jgi:hypothetical protein
MKTKQITRTVAALALLSSFILQPSALLAQGSLTPPGAPAPTMKTLDQVEPRTPISSAPYTITVPGSYYLTTNLTVSSGNAITIATNGVTLDLTGFSICSTAASATNRGIRLNSDLSNITIANGFIRGGVTNDGSGVYSGSGFSHGIYYSGNAPVNVLVSRVSVSGCLDNGINVGTGDSTVVESCTVRTVGGYGICASTIKQSSAIDCGAAAIIGKQASDCLGICSGDGSGVNVYNTAQNCIGHSDGMSSGVNAATVMNCYGYSYGGHGIHAGDTALNCFGYSHTGTGIYAVTAQNCLGTSSSSSGITANNAQNCYGDSDSGYGLYALDVAQNCYGYSGSSGIGLHAGIAQNCYGYSVSGTGLSATVANTCVGGRSGGTAISATIGIGCYAAAGTNVITYKYNMP